MQRFTPSISSLAYTLPSESPPSHSSRQDRSPGVDGNAPGRWPDGPASRSLSCRRIPLHSGDPLEKSPRPTLRRGMRGLRSPQVFGRNVTSGGYNGLTIHSELSRRKPPPSQNPNPESLSFFRTLSLCFKRSGRRVRISFRSSGRFSWTVPQTDRALIEVYPCVSLIRRS